MIRGKVTSATKKHTIQKKPSSFALSIQPAYMILGLGMIVLALVLTYKTSYSSGYRAADAKYINVNSTIQTYGYVPDVVLIEERVNQYRVSKGLSALVHDDRLCASAKKKALDMTSKGYFTHDSPDGLEPWVFILGYL